MTYPVLNAPEYDFTGQAYASQYPNLHRYPATMLPQLGIKILRDLSIKATRMLDPYCGSGSSFTAASVHGIRQMVGYDLNPLAVLITRAKFTRLNHDEIYQISRYLREVVWEDDLEDTETHIDLIPNFTNLAYWFSSSVIQKLARLRYLLNTIENEDNRRLFLVAFSETIRDCSYVRTREFKLYRIKPEQIVSFEPDVYGVFFTHLKRIRETYIHIYTRLIDKLDNISIDCAPYTSSKETYDLVLTSPPYGDSRTTVAYGQFSALSNAWMGVENARQIDQMLMGGHARKNLFEYGVMADVIHYIAIQDIKRAYEVSAFYQDLADSIRFVASGISPGGYSIYVVGNRTVKGIQLPNNQFIAEQFEAAGLIHCATMQRTISSKVMPSRNSPSNIAGETAQTMQHEYIVVCQQPS